MADTGYRNPGTCVDSSAVGTLAWSQPQNAMSSGGGYAEALEDSGVQQYTHYLKATNFGFSLPSNATVDGIVVEIKRYCEEESSIRDNAVKIVKATGAIGATSYQKGGYWPTSLIYYVYGSSTLKWGETWTYANINSSNFGVVLQARVGAYKEAKVDHIRIKVFYTVPIDYTDTCTDTITCTDAIVENEEGNDTLADTITCSDAIVESFGAFDACADIITCIDSISESFGAVDIVTDTITCTDTIIENEEGHDTIIDIITCTDTYTDQLVGFDSFDETVTCTDDLIEVHTWPIQYGAHNITLAEFIDSLKVQFGNRSDLESIGADKDINLYKVWLNLAYREITTRNQWWERKIDFHFPQLETDSFKERSFITTTAGVEYVSVPASTLIIRDVWNETNDRALDRVASWNEYVEYAGRGSSSGRNAPTEWIRNGTYLYLYPTPDATYALRVFFRKVPPELTEDSDVTLIGEEWDEIILLGAEIRGKVWLGDTDKGELQSSKDEWKKQVDGLIGIYLKEQINIDERIKPASEGIDFDFYM